MRTDGLAIRTAIRGVLLVFSGMRPTGVFHYGVRCGPYDRISVLSYLRFAVITTDLLTLQL